MTKDFNNEFVRNFIEHFCSIHKINEKDATLLLTSVFCCCYGLLTQEQRGNSIGAIMIMAISIGKERFEDGPDFVEFLSRD